MRNLLVLIASLLMLTPVDGGGSGPSGPFEAQGRECLFVVVGRVTKILPDANNRPNLGTGATAVLDVRRHLKGSSEVKQIEAEFRGEAADRLRPAARDAIWFVRRRMEDGRYLVTDRACGLDSLATVRAAIDRQDRRTRIPHMPAPDPGTNPVSMTLAALDGTGRALGRAKVASFRDLDLLVQFENHSQGDLTVMPCLDGSDDHMQYPHYDLEVLDYGGGAVERRRGDRCGNINPLKAVDFVALRPGEVFRTPVPTFGYHQLAPGLYRVRARYTARRVIEGQRIRLGRNDPQVPSLMGHVWEGTLRSAWIEVEVGDEAPHPPIK